jgi:FkbM family methyltransferase
MSKDQKKQSLKFSVILINSNYEKYIGQAIESVLNQTFTEFELIIVDDGSNDNSRNIISPFELEDDRVKIVFKEKEGLTSALNDGFDNAKGIYVVFLEGNAYFDPMKLESVFEAFCQYDYAMVQHNLEIIDAHGRHTGKTYPDLAIGEKDLLPHCLKIDPGICFAPISGVAAPRRILSRVFPIPQKDDKDISAEQLVVPLLTVFGKVNTLGKPLGYLRFHEKIDHKNLLSPAARNKLNNYTNRFLSRWGRSERIEIPLPIALLAKYHVKNVVLFGGRNDKKYLLESQALKNVVCIDGIFDEDSDYSEIEGLPTNKNFSFDTAIDVVLISDSKRELELSEKAINLGFNKIFTVYSHLNFKIHKKHFFIDIIASFRRNCVRKIALYGANVHSLNIILSEIIPNDIEIIAIIDDHPLLECLLDIPVIRPDDAERYCFDGLLISNNLSEKELFFKALEHGFENIYLIYEPFFMLRRNRADYEDIRRYFGKKWKTPVTIYGVSLFTQCLLQSCALDDTIDVVGVFDEKLPNCPSLCGVNIYHTESKKRPDFETLIVPPALGSKDLKDKLNYIGFDNILMLKQNPDEIQWVYEFLKDNFKYRIMFDVGANVGASLVPFAKDGWSIYAFEPDSVHRKVLQSKQSQYPELTVDKRALSDEVKTGVPLYRSNVSPGISGLSVFHASHYFSEHIDTTKLSIVIQENDVSNIDFLKIDTEGYDFFVLKGNDWKKFMPRILMCEFEDRKTIPLGYNFHDMACYLSDLGYHLVISEWEPVIEYGNQPRWVRLVTYPCDLLDTEAFGNIFAFRYNTDFNLFIKNHCLVP